MNTEAALITPGDVIRPDVTEETAIELVKKVYGFRVVSVKELVSYDDKNFHIKVADSHSNPYVDRIFEHGYVLKITNKLESLKMSFLDGQNEMMLFLGKNGVNCSQPVKNLGGHYMSLEEIPLEVNDDCTRNNSCQKSVGQHMVRLMTFLPGKTLHNVECTKELFYQSGQLVGRVDNLLKSFSHPGYTYLKTIWSLESIPKLKEFTFVLKNEERRRLAEEVIGDFIKNVLTKYDQLEKGMLHGDFNEHNILVESVENVSEKYRICGILDFGDTHYSCYLFELAVNICYSMLGCKTMDPILAGGYVLAGYGTERKIPELEFKLLKTSVAARFCQSLVMGEYTYQQSPGNEYVKSSAKRGWKILEQLWTRPDEYLCQIWRKIMSEYKVSNV